MNKKIAGVLFGATLAFGGTQVALDQACMPSLVPQTPIEEQLVDKTSSEKVSIKSCQILKTAPDGLHARNSLTVEITEIEKIEGGVQVMARVWKKDGTQIGFGTDGSVDIERFRIFNPPVLVPDPNGDIVRITEANKQLGTPRSERHYREDPKEAILQIIEHTVSVMTIHDEKMIEAGKVGRTTDTFYPVAGANSPADGAVASENSSGSWGTLQTAADGTSAGATETFFEPSAVQAVSGIGIRKFGSGWALSRGIVNFTTSSIGTDTISSATLSLIGRSGVVTNNKNTGNDLIMVTSATPASTANVTTADFDQIGNIGSPTTGAYSSGIDVGSISTVAYNDFALNATGIAAINVSGVTSMGLREGDDATTEPAGWASGDRNSADFLTADNTGTTNDPKLVVVHTAAASAAVSNAPGVIIIDDK